MTADIIDFTKVKEKKIRPKTVLGVGTVDVDYNIYIVSELPKQNGKRRQKREWACPYYTTWHNMLTRCYNEKYQKRKPSYVGCYVCEEWLSLNNFKAWMEQQDWEGKQLDKDLLVDSNKVYSPATCVFVSQAINKFMRTSSRGNLKTGVQWHKRDKRFHANCHNPFIKKVEFLGLFKTEDEAHRAWGARKLQLAYQLIEHETNEIIAAALIARYKKYED